MSTDPFIQGVADLIEGHQSPAEDERRDQRDTRRLAIDAEDE